jgi:dipeptidyl aminopeptidase/acylaminoacyl peptidase
VDVDDRTNDWELFVYENGRARLLLEGESEIGEGVDLQGLMPDGRLAIIDESETSGLDVLYAIDPADGAREIVFEQADADVTYALNDPWTRRIVGAIWSGADSGRIYFDPELEAASERLAERFELGAAWVESWSRDRSRILVFGELGLDGGAYYVFYPADDTLMLVSRRYPELAEAALGVRQEISFPARDGTRIPAYLTLPALENPQNLPMVVLVHGGPHGVHDSINFSYMATFLASRGHAVLQVNYRGSGGYGEAWERAGYGQWGGLMQTDVEDGVVAMETLDFIDTERTCIVGGSYGGYAALAGATLTPDRYKCAISIAGVSDLEVMLRQEEREQGQESPTVQFWRRTIGDRQEDRERIRSVSPARLADRVQIPILLMHGTDDTVVPISQSRRMLDRLRDARKDVRFVELSGDDHWLSDAETRILVLREMETFLAQHIGPAAQ